MIILPRQIGLVIHHDFISRRERRRRQQIQFFQSLQFFVLYLRMTPTRCSTPQTWVLRDHKIGFSDP